MTDEAKKVPEQQGARAVTAVLIVLKEDHSVVPVHDIGTVMFNGHPLPIDRIATPHEAYRLCMDAAEQYSSMRVIAQVTQYAAQLSERNRDDLIAILGGPAGSDRLKALKAQRAEAISARRAAEEAKQRAGG